MVGDSKSAQDSKESQSFLLNLLNRRQIDVEQLKGMCEAKLVKGIVRGQLSGEMVGFS